MRIKKLFVALIMIMFVAVLTACGVGATDTPYFKAKDGTFALNDKGEYVAVVDGEITEMDIKSQFSVTDDYELKLYSDSSFTIEVRGKVQLYVGENTFYLCVIKDGETVENYVVYVNRAKQCKVTFMDGNVTLKELYVTTGKTIATNDIPVPQKAGYEFDGWTVSIDGVVTENFTTVAKWKAKTDTPYSVCHYKQAVAGQSNYELFETENLTGTTQTTATANQKDYLGYSFNENKSVLSGVILGDGSLVLNLYYDAIKAYYTVKIYEENRNNNEYTEIVGERQSLSGNLTSTVTFAPNEKTGFIIDDSSVLSIVLGESAETNVIKVFYKRIRTTVTFEPTNETRTAKYGFGLVKADGSVDSAPTFASTAGAGQECYWANLGATTEVNFTTLTENISVEERVKAKTNTIFFDLDLESDIDVDGVQYDVGDQVTQEYADGSEVSFSVNVNEDYNRSRVKYYFKTNAGASKLSCVETSNGVYTYVFMPSDDGVVYAVGEYIENTYDVKFTIDLFDAEWGTLKSLNGVKYTVDGTEYTVTEAGEITLKLKKGAYSIKITEPNGKEYEYTANVNPSGWEEKRVFALDLGKYVAGYSRIASNLTDTCVRADGTIQVSKTATSWFNLTDCNTSGNFALKMRYTVGTISDTDPKIGFQIKVGDYRILNVFVKHTHLLIQGGFSGDVGTVSFAHGISQLASHSNANPLVLELMLVKTSESLKLYYNVVEVNDDGKFTLLATVTSEQTTVGETTTANDEKLTATVNGLLSETLGGNAVKITVNVLVSAQGERTVTYSHYGVKNNDLPSDSEDESDDGSNNESDGFDSKEWTDHF